MEVIVVPAVAAIIKLSELDSNLNTMFTHIDLATEHVRQEYVLTNNICMNSRS